MLKKSFFITFLLMVSSALTLSAAEKHHSLTSPNGKINMVITAGNGLSYQISYENSVILSNSTIDLILPKGISVGKVVRVIGVQRKKIVEKVDAPFYRFSEFVAGCNELTLKFKGGFGVTFRAYDEGIAYRFYINKKEQVVIENEVAELNFPGDYTTYLP